MSGMITRNQEATVPRIPGFSVVLCFFGFLLIQTLVVAQEPILASYKRNFLRAGLADKDRILRDAATDEKAPEFIGELYEFALNFILQNMDILQKDTDFTALTLTVIRGLGASGRREAMDNLGQAFFRFQDTLIRVEAVNALAVLGKGNARVVENLNQYLADQNSHFLSGVPSEYPVLSACITALGIIGDDSSYPALFSTVIAGYPEAVTREAASALQAVPGNLRQYLIGIIRRNPPVEKLAAFNLLSNTRKLTDPERADAAVVALEIGLDLFADNKEEAAAANMRYAAIRTLGDLRWTRATSLVIKHFYRVQQDYSNGTASREQVVEAIACLGDMGSSEAAQVLALHLGFLNSRMERSGECDDAVTLSVIQALGVIGDKIAFDYLLYISYLPYPEGIKDAAKDALNRLKW
ncbi:MAG: HEAT repeat domain-containing protein [Treponema sp.]|jgi:HEAT repeat protein|nr:HEAT repeat domain-containing protein [Treponema sp.]